MFRVYDAPGTSAALGFFAASMAMSSQVAFYGVLIALMGARLKVKPMLVGAFMGAASLGAMGVADHLERSARLDHTEMAPSSAPSLKP